MKCGDDWSGLGACVPNHSPFWCFIFILIVNVECNYGVDYAEMPCC